MTLKNVAEVFPMKPLLPSPPQSMLQKTHRLGDQTKFLSKSLNRDKNPCRVGFKTL